jgi:hypothetical protein
VGNSEVLKPYKASAVMWPGPTDPKSITMYFSSLIQCWKVEVSKLPLVKVDQEFSGEIKAKFPPSMEEMFISRNVRIIPISP